VRQVILIQVSTTSSLVEAVVLDILLHLETEDLVVVEQEHLLISHLFHYQDHLVLR
tara:strand:- start:857 stop:1024 length:168 start_codon:yes stop_codon:yes gene_type:complete